LKIFTKLLIISLCIFLLAGVAFAKKAKKLPVGAYIKSAKIEILSGDFERYEVAIALLDSLFLNYGPHAEGIHLMGQIMVDYIDRTPGYDKKIPYVEKLVAYADSLKLCCEDKDIKTKYKSDCSKYIQMSDSTKVKFWREFYNNGIELLNRIDEINEEIDRQTDSATIEKFKNKLNIVADSCIGNMQLTILIDPNDYRGYVGVSSTYEKINDFEKANEWMIKGLDKTENRSNLLLSIAYNLIKLNEYCKSIPYFKEYVDANPTDASNMYNLTICYNNCGFYDSALVYDHKILEIEPSNLDALKAIAQYHSQIARFASDSASAYQSLENEAKIKEWHVERDKAFDSSMYYFKKAIDAQPDDIMALEQFGTIGTIRNKLDDAIFAFTKLTELEPNQADYWRILGDCNLRLKQFDAAVTSYEKVVSIEDTDKETWERLRDLYEQLGKKAKQTEVEKKLKNLN